VRLSVDGVVPSQSATFEAQRGIAIDAVDCIVLDVDGPLPFGIALD
jgi:hypothetical protein